jgi:hypothetical protein
MTWEEDIKFLEEHGWEVECHSPFEIRTKDGSFASGEAANIVLADLKSEHGITFDKAEMKDCFFAGMNRGCYAASLIAGRPIESFPSFDEYIEKYNENE